MTTLPGAADARAATALPLLGLGDFAEPFSQGETLRKAVDLQQLDFGIGQNS